MQYFGLLSLALGLYLLGPLRTAQAVEEDGQLWATVTAASPTWKKLRADLLLQIRTRDEMSDLERYLISPSLSYVATERISFTLGYDAHLVRSPIKIDEQRAWQQASGKTPIGVFPINHRLRLEERFIQGLNEVPVRFRYLIQVQTPVLISKIRFVVRDEVFFNLNQPTNAFERGFAENRGFLGFQRALTERTQVELGYQSQYIRRPNEDILNHALMLGLGVRF